MSFHPLLWELLCWYSHPRKISLQSITIHWALSICDRLLHNFAIFKVADENMFSFCLLLQLLPFLSYTFFTVSMEEGKVKVFPSVTGTSAGLTAATESDRFFIQKCEWKLCLAAKGTAILRHVRSTSFKSQIHRLGMLQFWNMLITVSTDPESCGTYNSWESSSSGRLREQFLFASGH